MGQRRALLKRQVTAPPPAPGVITFANQGWAFSGHGLATSFTVTTLVDHPIGTLAFEITTTGGNTLNSVTVGGDTFTITAQLSGHAIGYLHNAAPVAAGSTVTFTFSNANGRKYASLRSAVGLAVAAPTEVGTVVQATTDTAAFTATVANDNSLVFASIYVGNGAADSFTESAGFTSDQSATGDSRILRTSHHIAAVAGSVGYSAVNGAVRTLTYNYQVFRGA